MTMMIILFFSSSFTSHLWPPLCHLSKKAEATTATAVTTTLRAFLTLWNSFESHSLHLGRPPWGPFAKVQYSRAIQCVGIGAQISGDLVALSHQPKDAQYTSIGLRYVYYGCGGFCTATTQTATNLLEPIFAYEYEPQIAALCWLNNIKHLDMGAGFIGWQCWRLFSAENS
jgi:hypothetical protein